jgi:hypothetical protein
MSKGKLKEGQEVTINIPFTYTIGEMGYHSGKVLETIEDCENEVRAEIEAGVLNEDEVFLEVGKVE